MVNKISDLSGMRSLTPHSKTLLRLTELLVSELRKNDRGKKPGTIIYVFRLDLMHRT